MDSYVKYNSTCTLDYPAWMIGSIGSKAASTKMDSNIDALPRVIAELIAGRS